MIEIDVGAEAVAEAERTARLLAPPIGPRVSLSEDQEAAVQAVRRWWAGSGQGFRLGGLAGTGKTTIAAVLPHALRLRPNQVAYCAPTGKAAKVLHEKLAIAGARSEPTTMHRLMYHPRDVHCPRCPAVEGWQCHRHTVAGCGCGVRFTKAERLAPRLRLVIVDEASMVDEDLHHDLLSYGVRVVWIGDHFQLPPVRGSLNLMADPDVALEAVHRQAAGSSVLRLANEIRHYVEMSIDPADFAPEVAWVNGEAEVVVGADELDATMFLCHRNATRVAINADVRHQLGHPPNRPVVGDRVICLRNNAEAGIVNGTLGTVTTIEGASGAYRVTVDTLGPSGPYTGIVSARQFGQESTVPDRGVDLWDYGYCLTVHKAQGSEADRVVIVDEYPARRSGEEARRRWLYTAITRAKREVVILDGV